MFLSDLSIRRPVTAAVMMLALVTLGIFSYRRLPVDLEPNVEIPVVTIVTPYPGASPETVEREVTRPIEQTLNPIPGVKKVMSTSREGVSLVVVEFYLEVRNTEAAADVRAKISAIRGELPRQIEEPIIQKIDTNSFAVITMAVRSPNLSAREITALADRKIRRRLENLPGVGKIDLIGGTKREVHIEIDPQRLEYLGMGVNEVIAGLQSENVNTPLGRLTSGATEASLRVSGKPDAVARFGEMVVAERDGRPIPLSEVARVVDGQEEKRSLALLNGEPTVALSLLKQSDANTVEVADRIKREMVRLEKELPAGTTLEVVGDSSEFVKDNIRDLKTSVLLGGALTIFIVFCFLNSWRSTIITGVTLPISVISSCIVMHFLDMSLNIMTMMALSLVIGILIDDAIVVRENIVRHLEMGQNHYEAARKGTSEIGLAVLATTLSIISVFVPVAFMKGIVGRYFFQFGFTVAFAVLVSLLVSFTLDPMLSSRWPDPSIGKKGRHGPIWRILAHFNNAFEALADRYQKWLAWSLDHRKSVLLLAVLAFVGGMAIMGKLDKAFMTDYDRGEFQVNFKTAPAASFQETKGRLDLMLAAIKDIPEIHHTFSSIGGGDTGTVREGSIYIKLVDRDKRARSQEPIRQEVRERLGSVAGIQYSVEREPASQYEKPLQVQLRGESIPQLKRYAAEYKEKLRKIPGLVDLDFTMELDAPEYRLTVDRQRAADAGLRTSDVAGTLATLVGGLIISTYEDEAGEAVDVRVRLPEEMRRDVAQVGSLRLVSRDSSGKAASIPIADLTRYERSSTPTEISREAMTRQVVVSGNLDNVPLGTAVQAATNAATEMQMAPGYYFTFGGETDQMNETFMYIVEALLLAVVFVYLILAAQFESFLDPLAIMLSLPLSILGMAGMLYITGDTLNIMSMIGLIMLMGLVTKNAILLVDYAKVLRRKGMDRRSALVKSGRTRLRPILMTTTAMILGMSPMALALGSGAEMRAPMARAVVGGLITSTFLTLLVVPVVYTILDDITVWLLRVMRVKAVHTEEA